MNDEAKTHRIPDIEDLMAMADEYAERFVWDSEMPQRDRLRAALESALAAPLVQPPEPKQLSDDLVSALNYATDSRAALLQAEFERGRRAGITQVYDSMLAKEAAPELTDEQIAMTLPSARLIGNARTRPVKPHCATSLGQC